MTQELIYTSAPKGLQLGSRGFCTVACTAGMAKPLADRLEALSGYKHLYPPGSESAHLNPVNYSFVTFKLGGKTYYVLSRIADAGLDHTQRSNKIAHHVVLESFELPASGPAWLMSQAGFFVTAWESEPCHLESRRISSGGDLPLAVCGAWKRAAGDAGWAGVVAGSLAKPESYVIRPNDTDCLSLVMEAQSILSSSDRWSATFSTCFVGVPPGVDCKWRFVTENSQDAVKARRTPGGLLVDLTKERALSEKSHLITTARTGKSQEVEDLDVRSRDSQERFQEQRNENRQAIECEQPLPLAIANAPIQPPRLPPLPISAYSRVEKHSRLRSATALVFFGTLALIAMGASAFLWWERSSLPAETSVVPAETNNGPAHDLQSAVSKSNKTIGDQQPLNTDSSGEDPESDERLQSENLPSGAQAEEGSPAEVPEKEPNEPAKQVLAEPQPASPPIEPSLFDMPRHEIALADPAPPTVGDVRGKEPVISKIGLLPSGIEPSFRLYGAAPRRSNGGLVTDRTGIEKVTDPSNSWGLRLGQALVGRFQLDEKTRQFGFSWNSIGSPPSPEQMAEVRSLAVEISDPEGDAPKSTILFLSVRSVEKQGFRPSLSSRSVQKISELRGTPAHQRIEVKGHLSCDGKAFSISEAMDIKEGEEGNVITFGPTNCLRAQLLIRKGSGVPRTLCLRIWAVDEKREERSIDYFIKTVANRRHSLIAQSASASLDIIDSMPLKEGVRDALNNVLAKHNVQHDRSDPRNDFRAFLDSADIDTKSKVEQVLRNVVTQALQDQLSTPEPWLALDSHINNYGSLMTLQNTVNSLRCHAVVSRILLQVGSADGVSQRVISEVIGEEG